MVPLLLVPISKLLVPALLGWWGWWGGVVGGGGVVGVVVEWEELEVVYGVVDGMEVVVGMEVLVV